MGLIWNSRRLVAHKGPKVCLPTTVDFSMGVKAKGPPEKKNGKSIGWVCLGVLEKTRSCHRAKKNHPICSWFLGPTLKAVTERLG